MKISDIKDLLSKNEEDLQKRIEEITVRLAYSTGMCPGSTSDPQ